MGNFFSNAWDKIKGAASYVGNALSGNNQANVISSVTPSPTQTVSLSKLYEAADAGALGPSPWAKSGETFGNQTVATTLSGGTTFVPTGSSAATAQSYVGYPTSTVASTVQQARPSTYTWTAPTDSYGRTSSSTAGTTYLDDKGKMITPQTGFSGMGGTSSTPAFSSSSGLQGSQGVAGGSAFTGLLGGAGSGGQTGIMSDEQKRKEAEDINKQRAAQGLPPTPNVANVPTSMNGTIPAPEVSTPNFDLNQLTTSKTNIQKYLTNPKAMSQADLETTLSQLQTDFNRIKGQYDQTQPVPQNPVVDTPEQADFLQNSPDQFGVKQLMDEYRAANTNLSQLEGQRIDVQKQILALNDAYKPIIDDIKNNPDLPKGLAQRRLNLLQEQQKKVLQGFLDQQTILTQQISDQNQTVNRAFNIVQNAQSQEEKARDNARQDLSLFIQSGAIGGFSAQDIKQYSQITGYSTNTLQKMVSTAKTPKIDAQYKENANGDLTAIDSNTGKVLWTAKGVGTPSKSTTNESVGTSNFVDIIQQAIDAGATPEQAAREAATVSENSGVPVDQKTLNTWTTQARSIKKTPASTQVATPVTPAVTTKPSMWSSVNQFIDGISNFLFGK